MNAAVWFGAAAFFVLGAAPAFSSREMEELIGPRQFPYFSVALAQVIAERCFFLQLICGLVAIGLALADWLYSGRVPDRLWRWLVAVLVVANLFLGVVAQPKIKKWHQEAYLVTTRPDVRKVAIQSFRAWHRVADMLNLFLVGGLGVIMWRMAKPPDPTRFMSTTKFRS